MEGFIATLNAAPVATSDYKLLVGALRNALDMNHRRIVQTAQRQWEAHLRGRDESDRCVSVRVRRTALI